MSEKKITIKISEPKPTPTPKVPIPDPFRVPTVRPGSWADIQRKRKDY
jgi:hypothetical protein